MTKHGFFSPALEADLAAVDGQEQPAAEVVGRVGVAAVRRVALHHRRVAGRQRGRRPAAFVDLLLFIVVVAAAKRGKDLAIHAVILAILEFTGSAWQK